MKKERGFIGLILLVVIALVLAKYFYNIDVFQAADTEHGQETLGYTHQLAVTVWSYIRTPIEFAWQKIIWPVLFLAWQSFQQFLTWGHSVVSTPVR